MNTDIHAMIMFFDAFFKKLPVILFIIFVGVLLAITYKLSVVLDTLDDEEIVN